MNMQILRDNNPLWDEYVQAHPDGTVFHLTAWKRVVEKSFGHKSHYFSAEDQGRICGILPVGEINSRLFGHYMVSVPFAEIGGPLADDSATAQALVDQAASLADQKNVQYLEVRSRAELPGLPVKSLYYNFRKQISDDHEKNLLAIPRKSRAMVRNAIKKGLTAEFGHHLLPEFYKILALNYHRLGTPVFPEKFFSHFLAEFGHTADLLVVRTKQGAPAAAVLFFTFKDQMIPYYAGSDFTHRNLGPNDFMYWELMKRAVETGCTIFDFGRSKQDTGSFRFKKHWGFDPVPLAYQYHLVQAPAVPNLSPANPKYQKKIQMWQKMPHPLTKLIGPFIARSLG